MSGRAAFRWLWAGQTASVFGSAISRLAIPTIAIISLGATPFAVGVLGAVEVAAFPLLGLVAGVWVDRWSRRSTMLVADIVRALALATIPLAALGHVLGYAQLLVVAACSGVASVFFAIAYQSLVPSLVESDALERANARLEFTNSAAQIAGNGLAGGLIALVGAPLTIIIDAASYVVSVVTLGALRVRETHRDAQARPARFGPAMREGLAVVFGSPVLVQTMAAVALTNFGTSMLVSVYLIYAYRLLHLSPAVVGLLFALANFGFAGALLAPRLARRFGAGRTLLWSAAIPAVAHFAYPLALVAPPIPVLFVVELTSTMLVPIFNITQVSLRHRLVPPDQHGRMNATFRSVVWGTLPLGTLAGGALGGTIGIVPALVAGAIVAASGVVPLLSRPIRELRATSTVTPGSAA